MFTPPPRTTHNATISTTRRFGNSGAKNELCVSGKQYEKVYSKEHSTKMAKSYTRITKITLTKCTFDDANVLVISFVLIISICLTPEPFIMQQSRPHEGLAIRDRKTSSASGKNSMNKCNKQNSSPKPRKVMIELRK